MICMPMTLVHQMIRKEYVPRCLLFHFQSHTWLHIAPLTPSLHTKCSKRLHFRFENASFH